MHIGGVTYISSIFAERLKSAVIAVNQTVQCLQADWLSRLQYVGMHPGGWMAQLE